MKEIYVINLSKKRISLLLGVFLVMLGSTLWLGLKIGRSDLKEVAHPNDLLAIPEGEKRDAHEPMDSVLSLLDSSPESVAPKPTSVRQNKNLVPKSGKVPPLSESAIARREMEAIPIKNYDPLRRTLRRTKRATQKKAARNSSKSQAGHFSIQVAAFSKEKDASSLVRRMKADGFHDVRVDRGIRYYYVRTGRSRNKKMLAAKNERIKKLLNVKTLIVKRKGSHS